MLTRISLLHGCISTPTEIVSVGLDFTFAVKKVSTCHAHESNLRSRHNVWHLNPNLFPDPSNQKRNSRIHLCNYWQRKDAMNLQIKNTRLQLFTAHGNHLLRPAPTTCTDIFDPSTAFPHNTSVGNGYLSPTLLAHRMHDTRCILQHFIVIIHISTAHECKLGFISKAMYCPV